jgi:hypothetical protein
MQSLSGAGGTRLAKMGDRQDGDAHPLGHLSDGCQNTTNLCIVVTVCLAQIRADRVYADQPNITYLNNLSLEQIKISPKVEATPTFVLDADGTDNVDTSEIGSGRKKPGHDGIGLAIFGAEDNDAPLRGLALATWPFSAHSDPGFNIRRELALAGTRFSRKTSVLSPGDAPWPKPIDTFGSDLGRASTNESITAWRPFAVRLRFLRPDFVCDCAFVKACAVSIIPILHERKSFRPEMRASQPASFHRLTHACADFIPGGSSSAKTPRCLHAIEERGRDSRAAGYAVCGARGNI